jgi:hypothetical protein
MRHFLHTIMGRLRGRDAVVTHGAGGVTNGKAAPGRRRAPVSPVDEGATADYATIGFADPGMTRVGEHDMSGVRWIILHGPEGNPFDVFAPRPGA